MAILLEVKWVDKSDQPDPHQRIRAIGGDSMELRWKHSQAEAIESIERGLFAYYVEKDAHALKLDVGLTADGKKYLTIQADGKHPQSLLDLPECPNPAPVGSRPVEQAQVSPIPRS
ncbi:MAG: DUF3892 domain-containing protein [Verrucomicrobiota bacterium]